MINDIFYEKCFRHTVIMRIRIAETLLENSLYISWGRNYVLHVDLILFLISHIHILTFD